MKKIYSIFLSIAAVFSFTLTTNAQYTQNFEGIGNLTFKGSADDIGDNTEMGFSKHISSPVNGTYYIKLEAFAKGEATKTSEPSDFVLVLDVSGSMRFDMDGTEHNRYDPNSTKTRMYALKTAVKSFIDQINNNDKFDMGGNQRSSRLTNRISIITFSSGVSRESGLIELGTSLSNDRGAEQLKTIIDGLTPDGGTYAHLGMEDAYKVINFGDSYNGKTRKLRTVVLFTDGNPGLYGNWRYQDTWDSANSAISYANDIKKIANASKGIVSNVFTVSVINDPEPDATTYLEKTSSNYINATNMQNGSVNPDAKMDYALTATTSEALKAAFDAIAGIVGDAKNNELTSSSTTVDVISSSFTLPGTTPNPSQIKVYTAPYKYDKNREEGKKLYFGDLTLAPNSKDTFDEYEFVDGKKNFKGKKDVDNDIKVDPNKLQDNIIEITGFDYTNNWCGPIYEDKKLAGAQGHKVVILIPIQMAADAVGGPNVITNDVGSGIFKSTGGDAVVSFTSPAVSLPVNLSIKKENLKPGENAKFLIKRGILPERPADADAAWHPDYSQITNWEYVTSVMVPNKAGSNEVKIKGLPSTSADGDYVYRIIEEDWSWTYTFDSATGKGYVKTGSGESAVIDIKDITITDKFGVYSDQFVTNPITFTNSEEADSDIRVRHAESKATNTFAPKAAGSTEGKVTYSDSKGR